MMPAKSRNFFAFFLTNAGALAIGGVIAQLAYVLVESLIARRLGSSAYGTYSSSYAFIMIIVHLMDMGMYWKLIQDGSRNPATIREKLGTMLFTRVVIFFIAYPVLLGLVWWFQGDAQKLGFLAVFAFLGLQFGIHELLSAVYTARQNMMRNAIFQAAVPLSILIFTWLFVYQNPSLLGLALAFVIGSALLTAVWGTMIWRQEQPVIRVREIGSLLKECFHYGISGLVWNVYIRLGTLILTFTSSIEQVAFFAAAFKLVDLGFKFSVLTNRVVAPRLFSDSEHHPESFVKNTDVMMRLAASAGSVGAVVLMVCSDVIIRLVYGNEFSPSIPLLQILGVAMAVKTITLLAQTIVSAADDQRARTRIIIVATTAAILVALPLAIKWGDTGMACAVLAGDLLLLIMLMRRIRRINHEVRLASVFAIPLGAGLLAILLANTVPAGLLLRLLLSLMVFAVVFGVSGYLKPVLPVLMKKRAS